MARRAALVGGLMSKDEGRQHTNVETKPEVTQIGSSKDPLKFDRGSRTDTVPASSEV
jgi:hypothetical protein